MGANCVAIPRATCWAYNGAFVDKNALDDNNSRHQIKRWHELRVVYVAGRPRRVATNNYVKFKYMPTAKLCFHGSVVCPAVCISDQLARGQDHV